MMKKFLFLVALAYSSSTFSQTLYFPPSSGNWDTISPVSLNYCSERIDSLYQFLDQGNTKSFILLKDGKIVLEKYFNGFNQDSLWPWFSAGKSLTSVLVGLAQQQGYLDINDRSSDYLGKWTTMDTSKENLITIKHQLSMTTGLDEYDFTCTDSACLLYKADAGTRWYYHNAPYTLLTDVVERATGKNYNLFAQQELKSKIGMTGIWLPTGYNHFFWSNGRSMARFGLFMQAGGTWNGTPILTDTTYFNSMIRRSQNLNPSYGYLWWLNSADSIILPSTETLIKARLAADAPHDMYAASGAQGQYISVSPSKGLILVRQGLTSAASEHFLNEMWRLVLELDCLPGTISRNEFQEFSIYPNPVENTVQIRNPKHLQIQTIQVFNHVGQLVLSSAGSEFVDVSTLVHGHYLLQVTTDSSQSHFKFIK